MMRLLRGAGAAGLAAMAERGPGRIIRPMLNVKREAVLTYLGSIGENFVNDSSNQSSAILRNRIRTNLVPMMERCYAPGLRGRLAELASEMRALDDFVRTAAMRELESNSSIDGLDISRFAELHPALQAELLRQFIKRVSGSLRRVERVHIEAVRRLCLEGPSNSVVDIPGLRIGRVYGLLQVADDSKPAKRFMVKLQEGRIAIPEARVEFEMTRISREDTGVPRNKFEALFDVGEVGSGLLARNFRPGDRIGPLGMTGHRKVKDIFIDNKLTMGRRATFPVVELRGAIAWLPGIVRGRVGLVTEASENIVRVRASDISSPRHLR